MIQASPYRTVSQRNLLCCTAVGLVLAVAGAGTAQAAAAGPSIAVNGSTTDVTLSQSRTLIDWPSFDIGKDQTLNFHFLANKDIVLNRVTGVANVDGALNGLVGNQVGGNVWIYGGRGVVFGANARVNVGGLLTTTSPLMSDSDFLSGSGSLSFGGGLPAAGVTVKGGARLTSAGALALLAPSVATEAGAALTAGGTVTYGAAQNFKINFDASAGKGFDLISFEVPTSALEDGTVSATPLSIAGATSGANVMMAAVSRPSVMNALISIDGTVTARSASLGQGGEIILSASGAPSKTVLGSGSLLDAASTGAGQAGGRISVASNVIDAYGAMNASGPAGGGVIRVGGGFQGKDAQIANSEAVFIGKDAGLTADATVNGRGGDVTVWSDHWTGFTGKISARGGALGGDGGRAEVSSAGWLGYQGSADLRADMGHVGSLLLDPAEIRIVSGVAGAPLGTNDYTPGAGNKSTDLGTATIFTQLALGDLKISTDSASSKGDGTIEFVDGLDYVGVAPSNLLTLTAENGFVFTDPTPIKASGLGGFNLALDAGKAAFSTGAAVIDTRGKTDDGTLSIKGAGIDIGGALSSGALVLTSTGGNITQSAPITATSLFTADAGSDDIALTGANQLTDISLLNGSNIALVNDQATTITAASVTGVGDLNLATTTGGLTINGALTRSGSITLASAGSLSADAVTASSGDLSMKGSDIAFGGAVEATSGDVSLETTSKQLNLTETVTTGATKVATLKSSADIAQAAGGTITAGTVKGQSVGGAVLNKTNAVGALGDFSNTGGGQVALKTSLDLAVTGAVANTAGTPGAIDLTGKSIAVNGTLDGGSVSLTATGGDITQSAAIKTASGFSAEATGGAVTLTTAGNQIGGTIASLKGSTVSLKNNQATSIAAGAITSGGALSLATSAGALTVTGDLSQAGDITLASAGTLTADKVTATTGDVSMTGSTIAFKGAVKSNAGAVSLETTGGDLDLAQAVNAATTTTLKSAAGLTQSAAITTSALAAQANGAVALNAANQISGNVTQLKGAGVSLTNNQALTVIASPNIASTGDLSLVTTAGGLTISGGAISAPGDLTLTAATTLGLDSIASSTNGDLALKAAAISFVNPGSLSATSGDVSIETTATPLTLDRNITAGATKTVSLKASGAINQTSGVITGGAITGGSSGGASLTQSNAVSGLGAFTNKASGALALTTTKDLTVTGAVSNLPGAIVLTGKSVAVNATLTSNAGASSLTATNGSITQSAGITAASFSAQATGGKVVLDGANQITSVGTLEGQSITFNNGQATTISGLTIDAGGAGDVKLTTTAGSLTVPGITTAGSIVLDSAGALLGFPNLTSTASSISATSHGASMDLGALSATNALAGDIKLDANGQNITFSSLTAGRDATLSGKDISTAGVVTVGRDYSLKGETFSPLVTGPIGGVPRDFTLTDTLGGFTGSAMSAGRNLTINATDPGNNAPIELTNTSTLNGDLTVNGSSIVLDGTTDAATHAISLTAGQGSVTQALGSSVTAGKLSGSAVTGFRLGSATNAITSLGAITNSTSGGVTVHTSTGLDMTGNLTASGQLVEVVGTGGDFTQSGGVVDAAEFNVAGKNITATGANKAGVLRVNAFGGSADINIAKAVDLGFASITTGDLKVTAAGNLGITGGVTLGTAAGTQNLNLIATSGGAVTDSAAGAIKAGSVSGSSAGGFVLDSALHDIGRLQNVTDTSATGIQFTDSAGSLNVSGLSAVNGPITLSTPGALVLDGAVTGSSVAASPTTLISTGGAVSQTSAGVITAGQLQGSTITGFNLSTAGNSVGQLGDISNTTSGGIAFKAAGALLLPGKLTATGQTVALTSGGAITQTGGGLISAGTLNANGAGGLGFGGANLLSVASLTNTGAGAVSLTNASASGLTASASTTGDITLKNNGNMTLGNIVAGPVAGPQTASFTSVNGAISQSVGTGITAGTVKGSAAGVFDLTNSINQVSHVGDFTGAVGAGLVSSAPLSIDGAVSGGTGLATFTAPSLTLSSTGSIKAGVTGVQLLSISGGGALTLAGDIATSGAVGLKSGGVVNQTAGAIGAGSLGAVGVGGITLGNVDAATITTLSNTTSGDILLTDKAAVVSSAAVSNPAGKITVSTPNGALAFTGAVQGSGDVSLNSLTGLSGTSASSTAGALSLTGAGVNFSGAAVGGGGATVDGKASSVTLGSLDSGAGDATVSGGAIAINTTVKVGRDYKLTGTGFSPNALTPTFAAGTGRDFILTDTAGGLTFTNLAAPRDLIVTATDGAVGDTAQIVGAGLSATAGKITVNGTRVTLAGPVTAPGGDISLTSTVGGIGLSGSVSTPNKVTLASAGTIAETGAGAVSAGRLAATANSGIALAGANNIAAIDNLTNGGAGGVLFRNTAPIMTLTAVTTGSGDIDVQSTGAITLPGPVTAPAGLRIVAGGALSGQTTSAATTTLGGNGVALNSVASTGATTINGGAGTVNVATASSGAGDLNVTGGVIGITTASSGQAAKIVGAGNVTLGAVTSTGAADLQSGGILAATTVQSGAGGLNLKGASVNVADARTTGAAVVTGANAINVTTQLKGGTGATINAGAGSIGLALVDAGTGALSVTGGPVQITSGAAGTTADVTGSTVDIATLTSGGTATVTAGAALTGGTLTSTTGDLVLKGSSVTLTSGSAGRDASLTATSGNVQLGDLTTTRNSGLSASGDISGNLISLGGDLTAQAGGDVAIKKILAGPASVLTLAGRDVVLGAAPGAIPGPGEAQPSGSLSIDASRDALINLSGPANLALLKAGRDARLSTLNGDATVGAAQAGNSIAINANGGSVGVGALTLGPGGVGASLVATNDIRLGAAVGAAPLAGQVLSAPATASITLDAGRDATVNLAGGARLDSLKSGRDVNASATGDLTVGSATATTGNIAMLGRSAVLTTGAAGGNLAVRAISQDVRVTTATAGGDIAVTADVGAANLKSARLTGAVGGVHGVTVTAGADATLGRLPGEAAPITAGTLALDAPSRATVTVKGANALVDLSGPANLTRVEATGGDVTVKSTGAITVAANGAAPNGLLATGAINVTGAGAVAVNSAQAGGAVNLTATAGGVSSGLTKGTAITATASGGVVSLAQTTASGGLTASGQSVSVSGGTQAGAGITLTSTAGDVTAADAVNATGDLTLKATGGGVTVSGASVATGKAQLLASGAISINSLTGSTVLARGSDLNLTGALVATKACAPACTDPTLVVESAQGGLNLGDATAADPFPAAPMTISKDEFGRFRGNAVSLYAGDSTNSASRGDVRIGDLALDLGQVDTLNVLAAGSNAVQVTGAVLPGAGGGGNLVIGAEDATAGWTPKVIYVTGGGGALGGGQVNGSLSQQKPLKSVTLNAVDDILFGAPGFVTAINQARTNGVSSINIIRNSPRGVQVQPADLNRVFLTADTMTLRANGVIVQQNTSLTGNQSGIILTNRGAASTVAGFGRTGLAGAGGVTPQLIDLSLSFYNPSGALISRQVVAASPFISLGSLSRSDSYRINGCAIGVGGACTPLPNTLVDISIGKLVEGVQLTAQDAPPPYDPTITGAGNEEIWRSNDCNRDDQLCR